MGQTERLSKLKCLLKCLLDAGQCLAKARLMAELETSPASLKRDIAHRRDRRNWPTAFDRERGGWRLDGAATVVGMPYELPGQGAPTHEEPTRRIRVQTVGARRPHLPHFQAVGTARLRRQRLHIEYLGRGRNDSQGRDVSPQRLIHHRDNGYLDARCHLRQALRSFSADSIRQVHVLDQQAIDVPAAELDTALGAGYGIFAGAQVQWAQLRFSPDRARCVAAESWRPNQKGRFDTEGRWLLDPPYADPREPLMDILRHVPAVEVPGPAGLREKVVEKLPAGVVKMGGKLTP
jgi:predicted DNA-binding transcriptional regulator YafY